MSARDRALILGGSIAGLFAAQALAGAYREVLVVDRDALIGTTGLRRATPQSFHAHGLLARGQQAIEELFPGITDEFAADGVPVGDVGSDLRWVINGRRLRQTSIGLTCLATPRTVLEDGVRTRVSALPNVRLLEHCDIVGLTTTADRRRVTGAQVFHQADARSEVLTADLVVDATGRGSRTPLWLSELGYQPPAEERVKIGLGYATRNFRMPAGLLGKDIGYIVAQTPSHPRGAVLARERRLPDGSDRYVLSLNAHAGDHPPADPAGFLEYARSVPVPEIYAAVRDAEPLNDIQTYRFPATQWRHYEKLTAFPAGLLLIGDSVASPNPVYAQGNTLSALAALALRTQVADGGEPDPRRYFAAITPNIQAAWDVNLAGDLRYPEIEGRRTPKLRIASAYINKVQRAAAHDDALTEAFLRAAGLVDPPQALFKLGTLLRTLRHSVLTEPRATQAEVR
ncbi:FAD-binding monooxygenase [Catellatospora sp. TT07R-123]|uniref:FAD-dependent oxidoreductase n=1 Tax=Catellatospora sp. TT07R-123 TaxID=2733863 RepID=UPI001B143151|nr:FAD-dependent oxidoreductase [Catellatospora sp. TT07R-123]GHJ43044.1 FAD-binding monooxygenase [Catellatospora sp. TT07R-123]